MSYAKKEINFISDSTKDEKVGGWEVLEAGNKFEDLVNNQILDNLSDVSIGDYRLGGDKISKTQLFKKLDYEDAGGSYLRLSVFSTFVPNANATERRVMIQEIDKDNHTRGMYVYRGLDGGVVVRRGVDDVYERNRLENDTDSNVAIRSLVNQIYKAQKNADLDNEAGVSYRTVGKDEIEKLSELLDRAKPYDGRIISKH
ncbi:hypothetical protein GX865_03595 [Candidatus Saccharibacteria bacterium]|jgi:hypothetical protein|nr:hypothetical protein [Candidatus Saccharibacteria bacterium]